MVGTTADFSRFGPPRPLQVNHLPCENCATLGRIGEVGLSTPGCASGDIRVYGDASNYRFFTRSVRPNLQLIEIPWGAAADLGNEPTTTSCPIVLWIVGVAPWDLDHLLDSLGLSGSSSEVAEYHSAYVIFRKHP